MRVRLAAVWLLSVCLLTGFPASAGAALGESSERPALPGPETEYEPQDVVRIVIGALSRNDEPFVDAGIETTFAFASPANKVNTGPLSKFIRMVKGPTYGIMVNHVKSEFSEVRFYGPDAYQLVHIVGADGAGIVFAFRLSRQAEGEHEGKWMTDAVWPVSGQTNDFQGF